MSVADAEDRDAERKDRFVEARRSGIVHAVRAAGKDDPGIPLGPDFIDRDLIEILQFRVHSEIPDTAGDQLVVLSSEIQYKYLFHVFLPYAL